MFLIFLFFYSWNLLCKYYAYARPATWTARTNMKKPEFIYDVFVLITQNMCLLLLYIRTTHSYPLLRYFMYRIINVYAHTHYTIYYTTQYIAFPYIEGKLCAYTIPYYAIEWKQLTAAAQHLRETVPIHCTLIQFHTQNTITRCRAYVFEIITNTTSHKPVLFWKIMSFNLFALHLCAIEADSVGSRHTHSYANAIVVLE